MTESSFIALIHNTALLLSMALVFDMIPYRRALGTASVAQVIPGVILSTIAVSVMLTPWIPVPGIVFDTRSILTSVTGLFFGSIPAVIVMITTSAVRIIQGGDGAITGTLVIVSTGITGIAWRHSRKGPLESITLSELFIFGLTVHIIMLLMMFSLPKGLTFTILPRISLPVILIYPAGTALLGLLLVNRLRRENANREISIQRDELKKKEELLNTTQSLTGVGGWEWDNITDALYWTDEVYRIHGIDPDYSEQTGDELLRLSLSCYEPEAREVIDEAFRRCRDVGIPYDLELPFRDLKGENIWIRTAGKPVYDRGRIVKVIGNIMDITNRKETEKKILADESRIRTIYDYSPVGIWEEDFSSLKSEFDRLHSTGVDNFRDYFGQNPDEVSRFASMVRILMINRACTDIFEVGCIDDIPLKLDFFFTEESFKIFKEELISIAEGETHFESEIPIRIHSGNIKVLYLRLAIVPGFEDTLERAIVVFQDITERKRFEQELAGSLKEKELLLRELQHRVKNNLNIVSGIIRIGEMNIIGDQAKKIFTEARNRINAISSIYENLYQSPDISSIELHLYISGLADSLIKTYTSGNRISLIKDLDKCTIGLKKGVPVGLIVNELFTNSLKYAFTPGKPGTLTVRLKNYDGIISLSVEDDGTGLPEGITAEDGGNMGLTLVRMLAEQLEGELAIQSVPGKGACIVIKFANG